MSSIALTGLFQKKSTKSKQQHFSEFVHQYADDLYRYAYWLSNSKVVAEDLVQETMLRAWKSIDKLQDGNAVKSWLFTILRRENARRFERKQFDYCDFPTEEVSCQRCDYDTSTEAHVLRNALKKLPVDYREPLLLQVEFGLSQKEIAQHLNISVAGAGTRLFRARQKLRELIE